MDSLKKLSHGDNYNLFLVCTILFLLFSLFFNLGGRTIENKDYLRYAEIGREILESGDWVMMHEGGKIYVDKPPLHFWIIALSYKVFGVTPFAARFPSAFFGLLGVLAVLFFTMKIEGTSWKTGVYAALFLLSSYGYSFFSRRTRIEIEFIFFFSLSLILFYEGYESAKKHHKLSLYALSWSCMGLAVLDKGPVGLIPVLIIITFVLFQREWERFSLKLFLTTFPAMLITVLPWLIMLAHHQDFTQYITILKAKQIITRRAQFFYYLPEFFKKFCPGSIFLIFLLPTLWRKKSLLRKNKPLFFTFLWASVYLFLIHLTTAKTHRYLLPAFPALAIITSWGTEKALTIRIKLRSLCKYWKFATGFICIAWPVVIWTLQGWSVKPFILAIIAFGIFLFIVKVVKDPVVFICVLWILLLLFVDLMETAYNKNRSDIMRLYVALTEHGIKADEALIYKTKGRVREILSFYYNKIIHEETDNNIDTAMKNRNIKAVITNPRWVNLIKNVWGKANAATQFIRDNRKRKDYDLCIVFLPD